MVSINISFDNKLQILIINFYYIWKLSEQIINVYIKSKHFNNLRIYDILEIREPEVFTDKIVPLEEDRCDT